MLAESFARASGVVGAREPGGSFLESIEAIAPARRGWHSHALTAADAAALGEAAQHALANSLDGAEPESRPLAAGPRLALRVPFLAAAFPEAEFVFLVNDPREALPVMLSAWRSQELISCPELPGWSGPPWSLPLTPNWSELHDLPLEAVVTEQWRAIADSALDGLESLPPERWVVCTLDSLLEDPRRELLRLCDKLELRYDQALLDPPEAARRGRPPPAALTPELERELPRLNRDRGAAASADRCAGAAGGGPQAGRIALRQRLDGLVRPPARSARFIACDLDLPGRPPRMRALYRGPAEHPLPPVRQADGDRGRKRQVRAGHADRGDRLS